MEVPVNELLPRAAKIAREFDNIPGLPHAEIELAAQEALAHAARLFDPAKDRFPTPGNCSLPSPSQDHDPILLRQRY